MLTGDLTKGHQLALLSEAKGKIGELYVWRNLIQLGAMPFLPVADITGADAVIWRPDGTLVEAQVKTTWPPEQAGYFNVPRLVPREALFIICVIMTEPPEAWIIPSDVFAANTTERRLLGLGLGTTPNEKRLRDKLAEYREAWYLIAGRPPVLDLSVSASSNHGIRDGSTHVGLSEITAVLDDVMQRIDSMVDELPEGGFKSYVASQTRWVSLNVGQLKQDLEALATRESKKAGPYVQTANLDERLKTLIGMLSSVDKAMEGIQGDLWDNQTTADLSLSRLRVASFQLQELERVAASLSSDL